MEERRDCYEVLGVSRKATEDEIRKAYRSAALKHHPDRNANDAEAAARFKEATEAYQILSDPEKRAIYNEYGFAGLEATQGFNSNVDISDIFGNVQDLFSEFFGGSSRSRTRNGPRRGPDVQVAERLSLRDAVLGCKREISLKLPVLCETCKGSGAAAGTQPVACTMCRGSGQVSTSRGFVMFTGPCQACHGEGRVIKTPCSKCKGSGQSEQTKKITVSFPAGIDHGHVLRVQGQGIQGSSGGSPGDVLVHVELEEDPLFQREGADLITRVQVSIVEATLGTQRKIVCFDEEPLMIEVPPGTQPNHIITIRDRGAPNLEGGRTRGKGSLHVVVEVVVPNPHSLTPKARALFDQLRSELSVPNKSTQPQAEVEQNA